MCIAAWVWQAHALYQFLLLLNRDEYHDRPTTPVGWWGEGSNQKILGGRDELGGGTWLGCTEHGRFSFLTNFREPDPHTGGTKSRGELPKRFLEETICPSEFAQEIAKEADQYNGFNLVVADLCTKTMFYISNRPKGKPISIQEVPPGVHVLSNANMDSPWFKAEKLHKDFSVLMNYQKEEVCEKEVVEKLMGDKTKADKSLLPNTGCDPEWEFTLSSIFIETDTKLGRYGTRSMAAISVTRSSKVTFYEKYIEDGIWKEHFFQYRIDKEQRTDK